MQADLLLDDADVKLVYDQQGNKREVLLSYEKYLTMMAMVKQYVRLCTRIKEQLQQPRGAGLTDWEDLLSDTTAEEADWLALSLEAFQQAWDNDEDAVYDRWRELYGVATR